MKLLALIAPYKKSVVAFVGSLAFLLGNSMSDGVLTGQEVWVSIGGTLTTTFGVYAFRNKPTTAAKE